MASLRFERVLALPGTLTASTMYIVKPNEGSLVEVYFTSTDGLSLFKVPGQSDIQAMITTAISGLGGSVSEVFPVADIAARDALVLANNAMVLVTDATGDATVAAGAALYFYTAAAVGNKWTKIAEYESMDFVADWATLINKPVSTVAEIDDAVAKRHTHANAAVLVEFTEDVNGKPLYKGLPISQDNLAVAEW